MRLGQQIRLDNSHYRPFDQHGALGPQPDNLHFKDVAGLVFSEVYKHHSLPKAIISDQDVLFMSIFWAQLNELLGIKLKISSTYHPQMDGATEQADCTIIQIL